MRRVPGRRRRWIALGVAILSDAPVIHLFAGAALILPMALAEYFSSALRAQGSVWTALAPRDLPPSRPRYGPMCSSWVIAASLTG